MATPSIPWLEPVPPWQVPVPPALCAGLSITPDEVPVVEVLHAPCTLAEVVAVRAGRFVPLFGLGATRAEAVRALANTVRALGPDADPRGADYALDMALHAGAGPGPMRALAQGATHGSVPVSYGSLALAYVSVLGSSDALRERVARELTGCRELSLDLVLALGAGGGDYGTFREHYALLSGAAESDAAPVRLVRAWFDFVLARRFAGYDVLHALGESATLDGPSRWLLATAYLVGGEERARAQVTELAEQCLAPVAALFPRLLGVVARELAEIVRRPMALRFQHLRCAASRDHASVAIRAWLSAAAAEPDAEDAPTPEGSAPRALGPEPTRAGKAAIEARAAAGEFLLDWFVPDREARDGVDAFVRKVLRVYHRLRGAEVIARVERELRPVGAERTDLERVVWGSP